MLRLLLQEVPFNTGECCAGDVTPSVCINPLYKSTNTPSTANSDAPNTAQYTPAVAAGPMSYATPATGVAPMTAPLMSALAAKTLFSAAPVIVEEPEDMEQDCEPVETASSGVQELGAIQQEPGNASVHCEGPVQPSITVNQERSPEESSKDVEDNLQPQTALPSSSHDATSMQSQRSAEQEPSCSVAHTDSTPPATDGTTGPPTEASDDAAGDAAPGTPMAQQPDQAQQEFSFAAAHRAFPRTPASAVRRSRLEADDAPTPIRNPLRIATPARSAFFLSLAFYRP